VRRVPGGAGRGVEVAEMLTAVGVLGVGLIRLRKPDSGSTA
jgi:hypothetical protein